MFNSEIRIMLKPSFVFSVIIFLSAIVAIRAISERGEPTVVSTNLEKIPMEINGCHAVEARFADYVYEELDADLHIYRHYRCNDSWQIDLYIGYYGTAKGGRTPHNPYACLPGAGWAIVKAERVEVVVQSEKRNSKVNYILAKKGDMYESVLHWYQSSGTKVLETGLKQNIQRFIGRILHNRNDGAFVRVSASSTAKAIEDADQKTKTFAASILTLLPMYWPEER
jgi:EpsI family protein